MKKLNKDHYNNSLSKLKKIKEDFDQKIEAKKMNYRSIYKLSAIIFLIFTLNMKFVAADLPTIPLDIDSKTFCVKDPDSFDRDYHHVMILIDRTSYLAEEQLNGLRTNYLMKLL